MRSKVAAGTSPWTDGYHVFAADFFSQSTYTVAGVQCDHPGFGTLLFSR
jgi:hypothetical protein